MPRLGRGVAPIQPRRPGPPPATDAAVVTAEGGVATATFSALPGAAAVTAAGSVATTTFSALAATPIAAAPGGVATTTFDALPPAGLTVTVAGGAATATFSALPATPTSPGTVTVAGGIATTTFSAVPPAVLTITVAGGVATTTFSAVGSAPSASSTLPGGVATATFSVRLPGRPLSSSFPNPEGHIGGGVGSGSAPGGTAATLTTALAGLNNDLIYTARTPGVSGNEITVTYVVAGVSTPLSVSVSGTAITVNVATDAGGNPTSTAAQVAAAIAANGDANFLVSAANAAGNDGTGVVTAMTAAALTGGTATIGGTDAFVQTSAPIFQIAPDYRFVLCDPLGAYLSVISRISLTKRLRFRRNAFETVTFTVPAADPQVRILHTDGEPFLSCSNRVLKVYRKESGRWIIRFTGPVEQVEQDGDANGLYAHVTAFGPGRILHQRLVRNAAGGIVNTTGNPISFTSVAGNTIAKTLVDRANTVAATGITTDPGLGAAFETTAVQTKEFEEGTMVGEAHEELTDTDTMDIWYQPLDRQDGILAAMRVETEQGENKPNAVFAYGMGNHSIAQFRRLRDGSQIANNVYAYADRPARGSTWGQSKTAVDSASQTKYRLRESLRFYSDKYTSEQLQALANFEQSLRRNPRETVSIVPAIERAPTPFTDYFVGDFIQVYADELLLQSMAGTQKVEELDIAVDDGGFERVTEIVGSLNAA